MFHAWKTLNSFCQRMQVFESFVSVQTNLKKCKWKQLRGRKRLSNSRVYRVLTSNLVSVGLPGRGVWLLLWITLPEFHSRKLGTPACAISRRDCANSNVGRWNKKRDRKIMRVIWSAARLPVRIPRSALWTPHQHNDTMNCIINWDLPNKEQTATHGHTCTHTPGNRHAWHLKHTRSNTNTQTQSQLK